MLRECMMVRSVVTHTAKVLKFKQITTFPEFATLGEQLLLILQRYSNLSKSQHMKRLENETNGCYSYCKGTQI